ncbi:hypothetical protein D046_7946B, partial [Vibrio parahaemolyticus V-223/04]
RKKSDLNVNASSSYTSSRGIHFLLT